MNKKMKEVDKVMIEKRPKSRTPTKVRHDQKKPRNKWVQNEEAENE